MKAEQVIKVDYTMSDEPLETSDIDGLDEAIERCRQEQPEDNILVRCADRVADYDVYWNEKTESVRIGAVMMQASYEVSDTPQATLEEVGQ